VGSWRHDGTRLAWWIAVVLAGCSVGEGQGELFGSISAPYCMVDEPEYQLQPSFYSGEITAGQLDLRVQRGSDIEGYSDGIIIHLRDVNEVFRNRIGIPIPVSAEDSDLLQAVVYLNQTCPSGFPDFFVTQPLILEGSGGEIVFDAIYAPDIDPGATRIAAELRDVTFTTPDDPDRAMATLSGRFDFFYQRGSPAQRFP